MNLPDIQMFNNLDGKTSISRVLYAAVVMTVMVVWAYISIRAEAMVIIDPGLIGVIAVLATQKGAQSFSENRTEEEGTS